MIKANELRIGNKIVSMGIDYDQGENKFHDPDGGEIITVDINNFTTIVENQSGYSPIPLTPEWLKRCGLTANPKEPDEYPQWSNLHMNIAKYDDGFYLYVTATDPYHSRSEGKKIEYVHQLQNISLDLYGEELTIKEMV
jgi:hypothetical protein